MTDANRESTLRRIAEWCRSWWVTYVRMSRQQRRDLIAILRSCEDDDLIEVERP